jgi:hypothetical protein
MDALQFAYWLQGFAELSGDEPPTPAQWKSMREHLALVFQKVTPPVGAPPLKKPSDFIPVWDVPPGARRAPPYGVTCISGQTMC